MTTREDRLPMACLRVHVTHQIHIKGFPPRGITRHDVATQMLEVGIRCIPFRPIDTSAAASGSSHRRPTTQSTWVWLCGTGSFTPASIFGIGRQSFSVVDVSHTVIDKREPKPLVSEYFAHAAIPAGDQLITEALERGADRIIFLQEAINRLGTARAGQLLDQYPSLQADDKEDLPSFSASGDEGYDDCVDDNNANEDGYCKMEDMDADAPIVNIAAAFSATGAAPSTPSKQEPSFAQGLKWSSPVRHSSMSPSPSPVSYQTRSASSGGESAALEARLEARLSGIERTVDRLTNSVHASIEATETQRVSTWRLEEMFVRFMADTRKVMKKSGALSETEDESKTPFAFGIQAAASSAPEASQGTVEVEGREGRARSPGRGSAPG